MNPDRRLFVVLLAAVLVAAPAAVMGLLCVGNACRPEEPPPADVPFCSLPREARSLLTAGFRESRAPHVMAVTDRRHAIAGGDLVEDAPWPSVADDGTVPLVFAGTGIGSGADVPAGTTLDAVAPTLSEAIGLRRPHPRVRTGEAVPGVVSGEIPRLVVVVVWRGVDSDDLERAPERWPVLRGLLEDGAGTTQAQVGSRPLDPAAVLTTIGTGAVPSEHGITGTLVRNEDGEVVPAWSDDAPFSVIAGLGDDLDELRGQEPRIGLVGTERADLGLVGGTWYVEHDQDDVVFAEAFDRQTRHVEELLADGYGTDGVPDLLGVVTSGSVGQLDAALGSILGSAERASGGSFVLAVTSTGSMANAGALPASDVVDAVETAVGAPVVEAAGVGGLFLDQAALASADVTDDRVVRALDGIRDEDGGRLFADAFPSLAVTFGRYC